MAARGGYSEIDTNRKMEALSPTDSPAEIQRPQGLSPAFTLRMLLRRAEVAETEVSAVEKALVDNGFKSVKIIASSPLAFLLEHCPGIKPGTAVAIGAAADEALAAQGTPAEVPAPPIPSVDPKPLLGIEERRSAGYCPPFPTISSNHEDAFK